MANEEGMTRKSVVRDPSLTDAFRQGFEEGIQMASTTQWVYEVEFMFEGTMLRRVQHSDSTLLLDEVRDHLANGPNTEVHIKVIGVPLQAQATQAVDAPEDGVIDVESEEVDPSQDD